MSINASGKGSSNMEADMDAAENARMNGTTDVRTETSPAEIKEKIFTGAKNEQNHRH
jgi:hypothetical protein